MVECTPGIVFTIDPKFNAKEEILLTEITATGSLNTAEGLVSHRQAPIEKPPEPEPEPQAPPEKPDDPVIAPPEPEPKPVKVPGKSNPPVTDPPPEKRGPPDLPFSRS